MDKDNAASSAVEYENKINVIDVILIDALSSIKRTFLMFCRTDERTLCVFN